MVVFCLGIAGSGKSLYVENHVATCKGKTLYVGTLPAHPLYIETIVEHQRRRPKEWGLLELSGDLIVDCACLENNIGLYDHVLLDGLTYYILRQLNLFTEGPIDALSKALKLIRWASKLETSLYVIDTPLTTQLQEKEWRTVRRMHLEIIRHSEQIIWVENSIGSPLSRWAYTHSKPRYKDRNHTITSTDDGDIKHESTSN